jgi:predicted transcriptional regulator
MAEKVSQGANSQLVTPIELILKDGKNLPPEELARRILETVSSTSGIYYSADKEISLLTAPARVLVTIIQEPNITVRALSIYLGISEAAVLKSLRLLLDNNLIAKTKVKGKNNYSVVKESFEKHSDIIHAIRAIAKVSSVAQLKPDDEPF